MFFASVFLLLQGNGAFVFLFLSSVNALFPTSIHTHTRIYICTIRFVCVTKFGGFLMMGILRSFEIGAYGMSLFGSHLGKNVKLDVRSDYLLCSL